MADGSWTEAVKFWGGLAGLGTAAFTLWDRAIRARPWVEPHVRLGEGASRPAFGYTLMDATACLRVFNPGPRTIGIGEVRFYPRLDNPMIALADDVGRELHPKRLQPIAAGEARLFDLIWRDPGPGEDLEDPIRVIIPWRPLSGRFPRLPLHLRISIAGLERLQRATVEAARVNAGLPIEG